MKENEKSSNYYNDVAKQLYNLALYALGDKALAERTAIRAFCDTYDMLGGRADLRVCREHCVKLLYTHGRRAWRELRKSRTGAYPREKRWPPCGAEGKELSALESLGFSSRFMILLFCYQKYTIPEIADVMRLPAFFVNMRLDAAAGKIAA